MFFFFYFRPVGMDENIAVQQAINESIQLHEPVTGGATIEEEKGPGDLDDENFASLIKEYATTNVHGDTRSIVVSRLSIWETAKPYFARERFLQRPGILQVTFATFESQEDAVDMGGPRREFFHLLLGAMSKESGTLISMLMYMYCFNLGRLTLIMKSKLYVCTYMYMYDL